MAYTESLTLCGPGGPFVPMRECARTFSEAGTCAVEVVKAEPSLWRGLWEEGVDLFYGGAPYMLEDFDYENPGILDVASAESLHRRRIGILVRPDNPLNIRELENLGRVGARLLDVRLEKMESFQDAGFDGVRRIAHAVLTGEQGRDAWLSRPDLDAWITYRTWHAALGGASGFVPISGREDAVRPMVVALTRNTAHRESASRFVSYLKTESAHGEFRRHGWE